MKSLRSRLSNGVSTITFRLLVPKIRKAKDFGFGPQIWCHAAHLGGQGRRRESYIYIYDYWKDNMAENAPYEHIFFPFADIFWSMRPMNTNRRALCCPELVDDFGYPYHCHIINRKFSTSFWSWNITSKMQNFAKNDYFHFWIFNFWKFFPWQFRFFANLLLELKMV